MRGAHARETRSPRSASSVFPRSFRLLPRAQRAARHQREKSINLFQKYGLIWTKCSKIWTYGPNVQKYGHFMDQGENMDQSIKYGPAGSLGIVVMLYIFYRMRIIFKEPFSFISNFCCFFFINSCQFMCVMN